VVNNSSTISLELDSKPQSVAVARGMLSAVLELVGSDPELVDDVKMAVSEACNNVVLHAYGGGIGPLIVELELSDQQLAVLVADRGVGIGDAAPADGRLGVGLPMMQTLADRAQFRDAAAGGTEVELAFGWDSRGPPTLQTGVGGTGARPFPAKPTGDVVVSNCPVSMLEAVLGRLATIMASTARFSVDRLSDVRLFTDAVAARVGAVSDEPVTFALATATRRLEVALGPFAVGIGVQLLPVRSPTTTVSLPLLLADEWGSEPFHGRELIRVVMTDPGAERSAAEWVGE
jgi:anti-sigma regulatory factor (Ser/Thr protein kinase)